LAVNKNFVVKNGLEVNTNLILADVDTNRVGIGTSIADYTLHVNGGIGATNLNVSGVATVTSLTVSNDISVTSLDTANVNITGVGTIVNAELTNITGTAATISSVATIGSVQIASGIVTATSGLVTYYGDGQYLRNIQSGVGLRTEGAIIGYGATFLDFRGAGVSTITAPVSGISTLFITGGGGGGSISISTTPPPAPGAGDLWYSPDRARTFIYYDESEVGYGTSKQWIDASPFNVGVLTGHSISVADLTVTGNANITGILTASLGSLDLGSSSLDVGNIISSGIVTATRLKSTGSLDVVNVNSSGIITATSFVGDGTGLTGVASTDNIITGTAATFNNDVNLNGYVSVGATMDFGDNDTLRFGAGNDLQILHDGTNSIIRENGTGSLIIAGTGETTAVFTDDGSVELYYDNSKKFETLGAGVTVTGTTFSNQLSVSGVSTFSNNVTMDGGDITFTSQGDKLIFTADASNPGSGGAIEISTSGSGTAEISGNSNELRIYNQQDANHSIAMRAGAYDFKDESADYYALFYQGSVRLYHPSSAGGITDQKLETTSSGVTVTGTLTATALVGDGSAITNLPATGVSVGKVFFLGAR
jgi:hypothetical protein